MHMVVVNLYVAQHHIVLKEALTVLTFTDYKANLKLKVITEALSMA